VRKKLSLAELAKRVLSWSAIANLVQPTPTRRTFQMSRGHRTVASFFLAAALFAPVVFSGCSARASYRVYDPGHEDYHVWDSNEGVYYQRWEVETHRDHRDFGKRNADEQKEYWNWRHGHADEKH
jgi:hypothetical protein